MKRYVLIVACITAFTCCQNSDSKTTAETNRLVADTANYTDIKWIDSVKNIGIVEPGKRTKIEFIFMNTGLKPLYIISAKPGCGCTVADYPKEAIAPGQKGLITAGYDVPKDGKDQFRKNITVTANTKGTTEHHIYFFGEIQDAGDSTNKATTVK